ncbi:MAG: hypothetical protein OXF08_01985 [Bacteroidetes bacterium]|nr:hypothetical protein [Bacteroidota bacterium]
MTLIEFSLNALALQFSLSSSVYVRRLSFQKLYYREFDEIEVLRGGRSG